MIDETVQNERIGFCQDCGKPLTRESVRTVGSGVFCEPCLETRIGAAAAFGGGGIPASGPGQPVAGGVPPVNMPLGTFPPLGGSDPKPVLAALLGLIPGVGAMYNGQFAKGIAHIVIFALLQSMARANDVFGILVAGWVFYQAFEAYHTAKARREGLPLPDPFGLNNIGAQLEAQFRGKAQGGPGATPTPEQPTGYPGWTGYVPPQAVVTPPFEPGAASTPTEWSGFPTPPPVAGYPGNPAYPQGAAAVYPQGAPPVYPQGAPPIQGVPVWDQRVWNVAGTPVAASAYDPANGAIDTPAAAGWANRFPAAAVWLIGFGVLFLVVNIVPELRFSVHKIFPFVVMALAVGIFLQRMSATGGLSPTSGGAIAYGPRVICALRMPVILFTAGVLMMLQAFDVIRFGRTWPVLVIVVGVLQLLERSVGNRAVPLPGPVDAVVNDGKGI